MRGLRPAGDYHEYLENPLGRYAFGDRFGSWAAEPDLAGFAVWGRAQREDCDALFRIFDRPIPQSMAAHCDVVFDARRIQGIDADSFDYFYRGSMARMPIFRERIRRQATVRPPGLLGAAAEGIANLFMPTYSWRVFSTLTEAFTWLERPDSAELAATLDALFDSAAYGSPVVARLQTWLGANGGRATLEEAAGALGLSVRSLQRSMGEANTTYRAEADRVRIELAKSLLLDGELKLETIAERIGCASLPSFSTFFRRVTGMTPSEFRARGQK